MRERTERGVYEAQQKVLSRLKEFTESERIQGFTVNRWRKSVNVSTDNPLDGNGLAMLEKVTEFEAWANQNGYTLQPRFKEQEVSSMLTGEEYTEIVLLIICLVCYEGEVLQSVYPYSDADTMYTVNNYLTGFNEIYSAEMVPPPQRPSGFDANSSKEGAD